MARAGRQGALLVGMLLAGPMQAQQQASSVLQDAQGRMQVSSDQGVTTLGEVRAIRPEEEQPLDLYRFNNPVQVQPNAFNRSWREPPSLEQVGMSGGYVMMGIYYAIARTAQGLHTITGAPDPVQAAIARPPPELSADQRRRAAQFCEGRECSDR